MMEIAGDGPRALGILWGLTGMTAVFVVLRLYTRLVIISSYGLDDHFFNAGFVSQAIPVNSAPEDLA